MSSASDIQNRALSFANTAQNNMAAMANNSMNFAFSPVEMDASWSSPGHVIGYNAGVINPPAAIAVPSVTATRPVAPALVSISDITVDNAPSLTAAEPILSLPTRPSATLPAAPGGSPVFNSPKLPTAPPLTLPPVPSFTGVVIPVAPTLDNLAFTGVLQADDLTAPSERFTFVEEEYKSALLDALKVKLMQDLVNGGYGIETRDELGLWEREREREARGAEALIQDVTRQFAARGMPMPAGALNAAVERAQQEALAKISSVNREIAIKRADMYVENRKFTMQEVRQVEDMLTKTYGFMMERTLNAAKAVVELGIAGYNAQLAKHAYRLERYKASASVYEALIRGQLAKVEQYKAQVEAAKLSAEVQRVHTDVYRIQVEGVNALSNIYRTSMEAAKIEAEVEQLKLQGFKLTVETYAAQVAAKSAEFGMYEAGVKGEMTKVSVYESSVRAYGAKTDAFKTQVEAQDVKVRAQVMANQGKLDEYKADIQRYSAELAASQHELTAAITKYEADVKKYSVTADAAIRSSQQNVEAGKANADVAVAHAQVIASSVTHMGQVMAAQSSASANAMAALAQAYGQASSGAMSAATGIEATITSN